MGVGMNDNLEPKDLYMSHLPDGACGYFLCSE